ncbi:hypothetical protein BC834DRAFT_857301 [Gloeopeniophorella convolvens]|nr:hypothetical protein BC834DRAFT_857301 [Gloeopeniophorella convolvens]
MLTTAFPEAGGEGRSLDDLINILAAAKKYDVASASERFLQSFADAAFLRDKPIEAFCAAYKYKLEAPARLAAKACLQVRLNLDLIGYKLSFLDGQALQHLWQYHRTCSVAAVTIFKDDNDGHQPRINLVGIGDRDPWWSTLLLKDRLVCSHCTHHTLSFIGYPDVRSIMVNSRWRDYLSRACTALREQPGTSALLRDDVLTPAYVGRTCDSKLCRCTALLLPEFARRVGVEMEKLILTRFYRRCHSSCHSVVVRIRDGRLRISVGADDPHTWIDCCVGCTARFVEGRA